MANFSTGTAVNLAPSGIASFAKCPICPDLNQLEADAAVLGAPCDIAIQGKSGARLGPRGIRLASTRFSYKPGGSYDPERDAFYLDSDRWRVVDCGDADYVPGDLEATFANITAATALIIKKKAMPIILGGDHSISYPVILGLKEAGPFNIIHFDAHLDWSKSVGGQNRSNGSPMRLSAGLDYVERAIHLGIRGIGSSGPADFAEARARGDLIYSVKQTRAAGIEKILADLNPKAPAYVTIDIDALDCSVTPGTGSPMFGGFLYDEMVDMLEAVAARTEVIGFDMVEVSPPYDDTAQTTCYLAARLISDFLGFITKNRE
ncbi:agmatinase [Deltaproteobacteria bacterium OttesenSCG-928-M10]|nr:agmatinase [Deltaproteobacteria bacterium OttesenSCG-928-M10]